MLFPQGDLINSHNRDLEEELTKLRRELQRDSISSASENTVSVSDIKQQLRSKSLELEETKLTLTETVSKLKRVESNLKNQIIELKGKISEKENTAQQLREELQDSTERKNTITQQQLDSLKNILSLKDQEIEELNHRLELCNIGNQSDENTTHYTLAKLKECQKQLEKCEKQRLDSLQAFQTSECEHRQIVHSYRAKIKEQNEKLSKMDRKMKSMEKYAHEQIDNLQENMAQEHNIAMEKMKMKMVELRKKHGATVETLRRQHTIEIDKLRKKSERRQMVTAPTQVIFTFDCKFSCMKAASGIDETYIQTQRIVLSLSD